MNLKDTQSDLNKAQTKGDLVKIASELSNDKAHRGIDKITYIYMCDFEDGVRHVQTMINQSLFFKK